MTAAPGPVAFEASALGKRRRGHWALRDCGFRLPAGRVCALVGPNGAGKSTLFSLAAGLLKPTTGSIRIFGAAPGDPVARSRVALLTQDRPLYPRFTVAETLRLGRELNPRWNQAAAEAVVGEGGVPLSARVGRLSGGQRTCVALALALGKRADLLLLDEPMADLDPVRRHAMMGALMAETAEHGTTVVMSTHVLSELDGVCDHLLLLGDGRVRLVDETEFVTAAHSLVTCAHGTTAADLPPELLRHTVVETRAVGRQLTALVRLATPLGDGWVAEQPSLEEILLAYLRCPDAPPLLAPGTPGTPADARTVTA